MEHFHPLDLGHGTATEWEAKDLAKVLRSTYQTMPKLKDCYMGLIHSHHSMGAFFSGTDTKTLEEMAPDKGFYCSLVVATAKDPFAFAFAYKDQYGQPQVYEADSDDIMTETPTASKAWIAIADGIEKNAAPINNYAIGAGGQISMMGGGWNSPQKYYNKITDIEKAGNPEFRKSHDYTEEECTAVESMVKDLEDGKINWLEFQEQMELQKLDAYEYYDRVPDDYAGYQGWSGYGY